MIEPLPISDTRVTDVTVPLEAPPQDINGGQWGRIVRTIVEVDTDDGLVAIGEPRGAGTSTEDTLLGLQRYLIGHDPFDLEAMRFKLLNPTAALYLNRTSPNSALEFACIPNDRWAEYSIPTREEAP